jgi:hypothetical protein
MWPEIYEYRLQGRRPATYLALGVGMAMASVNLTTEASWPAWALVSVFLATVLHILAVNRAAGLRIDPEKLEIFDGPRHKVVPLQRISEATLRRRYFGAHECILRLVDGKRIALPQNTLPPVKRLQAELDRRGVPIRC